MTTAFQPERIIPRIRGDRPLNTIFRKGVVEYRAGRYYYLITAHRPDGAVVVCSYADGVEAWGLSLPCDPGATVRELVKAGWEAQDA